MVSRRESVEEGGGWWGGENEIRRRTVRFGPGNRQGVRWRVGGKAEAALPVCPEVEPGQREASICSADCYAVDGNLYLRTVVYVLMVYAPTRISGHARIPHPVESVLSETDLNCFG